MLRVNYSTLVASAGLWGWIAALCHQYPPLAFLFFRNTSTPDAIVTMFYGCQSGAIVFVQDDSNSCAAYDGNCITMLFNASNVRSTDTLDMECTVMGQMENTPTMTTGTLIQAWQDAGILTVPDDDGTFWETVLGDAMSYGVPLAMLMMMLIP